MNTIAKSRTSLAALALAIILVAGCDRPGARAPREAPSAAQAGATVAEALPTGFTSATAKVNGTTLHYVVGGQGPALILLHGFPENWSTYAEMMPQLARRYRVVAVDLRGIGGSTPTEGGYDAATMAEDVYQLSRTLELNRPYVVGHDYGGRVAYAYARLHPDTVRGAMVVSTPIAGIDPWDTFKVSPEVWHFGFHKIPGFAEEVLTGREGVYIGHFMRGGVVDPRSITDEDVARYAAAYARPGRMAAAMGSYRAFEAEEKFNKERRSLLDVPIVLVGGGSPNKSVATLLPAIARGLKSAGVRSVAVETIPDSGHYIVDEKPTEVAALIQRYASHARDRK